MAKVKRRDGLEALSSEVADEGEWNRLLVDHQGALYVRNLMLDPSGDPEDVRGNDEVQIKASAAYTASWNGDDQTNVNARGVVVTIDCTVDPAAASVVFTIQGKDAESGKYYTILASAAVAGVETRVLRVYPGLTAAGNLTVSDVLPRTWRVIATHADTDSITYSVGASLVV